jgi:hypothetical protein
MKKRLTRVSPLQCGIVFGIFYGLMALIFVPFFLFAAAMRHGTASQVAVGGAFLVFLPILYGALGFVGGVIAAALYNLIAKWTGGLEFEVTEVPPAA